MQAIGRNSRGVVIRYGPTRPLVLLNARSPALGDFIIKRMGIVDLFRPLADARKTQSA